MDYNIFWIVIASLSSILTVVAYYMRDILYLRIIASLAFISAICYFYFFPSEPLWIVINWKILFLLINLVQIAILLIERRATTLSAEEEEIMYELGFSKLTKGEFKKVLKYGVFMSIPSGHTVIEQGLYPVENIYFMVHGLAEVLIDGCEIGVCRPGNFVGEISFITNRAATATVKAVEEIKVFQWKQNDLLNFFLEEKEIMIKVQNIINLDLINKILKINETKKG